MSIQYKDYIIRKAEYNDLPGIYELVIGLAIYEREPSAVTATLDDYQNLYTSNLFQCIVAVCDTKIVGMAIYYPSFSTWVGKMMYLEDLYIEEEHRRKGLGHLIFNLFLQESKSKGCKLVKWQVLHWNEIAINFYKQYPTRFDKEWWNGKIIF